MRPRRGFTIAEVLIAVTILVFVTGAAVQFMRRQTGLVTRETSRMDALQSQAMAVEVERRRIAELARIAGALERLEQGEYGYCVTCGEPIAPKRLELDPATPLCVNCAGRSG